MPCRKCEKKCPCHSCAVILVEILTPAPWADNDHKDQTKKEQHTQQQQQQKQFYMIFIQKDDNDDNDDNED